jgi:hypothetical protein
LKRHLRLLVAVCLATACTRGAPAGEPLPGPGLEPAACSPSSPVLALPREARESSGIGYSLRFPGLLWTHNDSGGEPVLLGVDRDGLLRGTLRVDGVRNVDWEDIEVVPCDDTSCIWIADVGDNGERRRDLTLLRVPEAPPDGGTPVRADLFPVVLPEGPRDIEALYVLPGQRPFLVTKGRRHPVTLYRYPPPLRPGVPVLLEAVQVLTPEVPSLRGRVTGASASRDGRTVVIRSYEDLRGYRPVGDSLIPIPGAVVNLRPLEEPQGEAVALGTNGELALTTEAGVWGRFPSLQFLRCGWAASGPQGITPRHQTDPPRRSYPIPDSGSLFP